MTSIAIGDIIGSVPEFLTHTYFGNTIQNYLIFFAIAAGGVIAAKIVYHIFQKFIKVLTKKSKTELDDIIVDMIEEPIVVYMVLIAIHGGWQFLAPNFPEASRIPVYYGHLLYMAFVLNTGWLIARLFTAIIDHMIKPFAAKTETDLDDHLIPIVNKLVKIIVFAISIIMILHEFGQEIGPLLAGLGIGGLAFALAAKDLLSNLFGSITILMDKPFSMGQRIKIQGEDGFVREINLRTTKIETLEGRFLYVPNAKFTDNIVENISQEWARKVKMDIGLVYNTDAKKMQKAKDILGSILDNQEGIDKTKRMVFFTEFGDFSKKILFVYWITDPNRIFHIQDEVNMKIMEEFGKANIEMAFPTQTIEIKR